MSRSLPALTMILSVGSRSQSEAGKAGQSPACRVHPALTVTAPAIVQRMDEYITPAEAAQRLHVDPSTLRKWHRQGRLESVRVQRTAGGQRRWHGGDIDALCGPEKAAPPAEYSPSSRVKKLRRTGSSLLLMFMVFTLMRLVQIAIIAAAGVSKAAAHSSENVDTSALQGTLQIALSLSMLGMLVGALACFGAALIYERTERMSLPSSKR